MDEKYYAHWSEDGRKQTVLAHLLCTAMLCAQFAEKFGEKALGYWAGLLHDIGKFTQAFQKRLSAVGKRWITPQQVPGKAKPICPYPSASWDTTAACRTWEVGRTKESLPTSAG